MRAEILTIGDELCRGEIVDTNSSHLAARLWDLSITTRWMTSCTDDDDDIATAVRQAVARADLVLCSGGLGPTEDDLTVDVVSRLAGVAPITDEAARQKLETWFAQRAAPAIETRDATRGGVNAPAPPVKRGREGPISMTAEPGGAGTAAPGLSPILLRQVRVPAGSRVFANPAGLAPGFEIPIAGVPVICLPGFPREIASILEAGLERRFVELREAAGEVERIARRIYRVFGKGESQISQACRGMIDGIPGVSIHYQVKFPETLVKLVVRGPDAAAADAALARLDTDIRARLEGILYGAGEETLIDRTVRRLIEAGKTVATAESCTGGMIGEMLTRRPGSSKAYLGGAIVYSNAEKVRQLGVSEATLERHGAVSEETVRELAAGARSRFGVDFAVAVSGVAGPDGGTPDKPVGTVWLCAAASGVGGDEILTELRNLPGDRAAVRRQSVRYALELLLRLDLPPGVA